MRDVQLLLNLAHDKSFGMSRKKQLNDAEPRFRSDGREHVRVSGNLAGIGFR